MPKVPTLERRGRIQPIRGAGLQVEAPGIEEPKAPKVAQKLLKEIYEAETKRINEIAVLDADLQGSKIETELLHKPKTGAMNQLGKNSAAIYGPTMEEYDKRIAETISGLANNTQKFEATKRAKLRRANIDRTVQRHVATQMLAYDNETSKKWQESEEARLGTMYNDPPAVKRSIQLQQRERARFAYRNGLSVEGEEDSEWLKDAKRDVASNSHKLVIKHLIADGADEAARDYYKENKKEIFNDVQLKKDIDVASSDGLASSTVADVVAKMGPKDDDDAFNIDIMMAELREKLKGNEKALKLAKVLLKERKTIHDASVKERADANESALWEMKDDGVSIKELFISPEYLALPGIRKHQFRTRVMQLDAMAKEELIIQQELNFSMLEEDMGLLRETDIDAMLTRKEITALQHHSLKRLLDPKNQPGAKRAFDILKGAETDNLFDEDKKKNRRIWAEYNLMLHQFLEDYPDGDPIEHMDELMKPIKTNWVEWYLDITRLGTPGTEQARERRIQELKKMSGAPIKQIDYQINKVYTDAQGRKAKYLGDGKWQITK